MDTWIEVDVSTLESREQKAAVEKTFEDCGWTYVRFIAVGYEPLTGIAIIKSIPFPLGQIGRTCLSAASFWLPGSKESVSLNQTHPRP